MDKTKLHSYEPKTSLQLARHKLGPTHAETPIGVGVCRAADNQIPAIQSRSIAQFLHQVAIHCLFRRRRSRFMENMDDE
jgi:hypothetical protein